MRTHFLVAGATPLTGWCTCLTVGLDVPPPSADLKVASPPATRLWWWWWWGWWCWPWHCPAELAPGSEWHLCTGSLVCLDIPCAFPSTSGGICPTVISHSLPFRALLVMINDYAYPLLAIARPASPPPHTWHRVNLDGYFRLSFYIEIPIFSFFFSDKYGAFFSATRVCARGGFTHARGASDPNGGSASTESR